jgi:hypothetical protein
MALKPVHALPRKQLNIYGPVVGKIAGYDEDRGILVDFPNNHGPPISARCIVALDRDTVEWAVANQQGAVLLFENDNATAPILLGLVQSTKLQEVCLAQPAETPKEALIDGRRVAIEARNEIVLRCGQASITLHRNGKVMLNGTQVVSQSTGVNRIRGGSVEIN